MVDYERYRGAQITQLRKELNELEIACAKKDRIIKNLEEVILRRTLWDSIKYHV